MSTECISTTRHRVLVVWLVWRGDKGSAVLGCRYFIVREPASTVPSGLPGDCWRWRSLGVFIYVFIDLSVSSPERVFHPPAQSRLSCAEKFSLFFVERRLGFVNVLDCAERFSLVFVERRLGFVYVPTNSTSLREFSTLHLYQHYICTNVYRIRKY